MTDIGIRELKAKASKVVQNVRRRHVRYIITHRGRPVAMLVPIDETLTQPPLTTAQTDDVWAELTQLGERLAQNWPTNQNSAEALSEMRR
jgi:prevent-host-death family protein